MQNKRITVIIRTTEDCNLACKYCYTKTYTRHEVLSLDIFKKMLKELLFFFDEITLIWQGGEPLLAGKEYFKEVVKIEKLKMLVNK